MKSPMSLVRTLITELGDQIGVSTTHDVKNVERRFEHEGLSFLTITLPAYAKATQKWLEHGKVERHDLPAFAWSSEGLPQFLGGFLARVFEPGTGRLFDEPCVDSILAIRQISLACSKMLLPCSDERVGAAMRKFVECEQEVRDGDKRRSVGLYEEFQRMSLSLFGDDVLMPLDRQVYEGDVLPKHGPGATADRLRGNAKYDQATWTRRLEAVFPFGEYAIPNWRYYYRLDDIDLLEPGAEIPVRVVPVPKTLQTPRIIAIEPTCMQYMQQAISERIVDAIEGSYLKGIIGFSDQIPNQDLARVGSLTGELATLDLSEASDRVSNQLVRAMCHLTPHLREALDATRSRKADVPGHGVQRLSKYASMGSALCFPVEAMVFCTVAFIGIQRELRRQLTKKDFMSFVGQVRVYGDDIIVPATYADSVITALGDFGLLVNRDKSFWTGKFRESCGREYFAGHDVSIVKVRRMLPTERRHTPEIVSLVSLRNQLYDAGLWRSAAYLDSVIVPLLGAFPIVEDTSSVLGRKSVFGYHAERIHPTLHHPLVRGWGVVAKPPHSPMSGEAALVKWFLKRGVNPLSKEHLEYAGRPKSADIRLRWATPY